MDRTLIALVDNQVDALLRTMGLIRRKGLVMKKISMEECDNEAFAFLKITIGGNKRGTNQIIHQIQKLIDVHEIRELKEVDKLKSFDKEYVNYSFYKKSVAKS